MNLWDKMKEHRLKLLLLSAFIIVGIWFVFLHDDDYELLNQEMRHVQKEVDVLNTNIAESPNELETVKIIVDVKGEVRKPGVYEIDSDARVIDVIQLAGGALEAADLNAINLAAFLQDGQVVYVPKIGEENPYWSGQSGNMNGNENSLVNINRASASELEQLPGIGPSKAMAIIQYREEHGPFSDVQQLLNVSGIGQKTLEKLLPYITVR